MIRGDYLSLADGWHLGEESSIEIDQEDFDGQMDLGSLDPPGWHPNLDPSGPAPPPFGWKSDEPQDSMTFSKSPSKMPSISEEEEEPVPAVTGGGPPPPPAPGAGAVTRIELSSFPSWPPPRRALKSGEHDF